MQELADHGSDANEKEIIKHMANLGLLLRVKLIRAMVKESISSGTYDMKLVTAVMQLVGSCNNFRLNTGRVSVVEDV
jgi:hypothetical protein